MSSKRIPLAGRASQARQSPGGFQHPAWPAGRTLKGASPAERIGAAGLRMKRWKSWRRHWTLRGAGGPNDCDGRNGRTHHARGPHAASAAVRWTCWTWLRGGALIAPTGSGAAEVMRPGHRYAKAIKRVPGRQSRFGVARAVALALALTLSCLLLAAPALGEERSLSVTATAYNSVESQTDSEPWVGAWGDDLEPGMRVIAVSRDLLELGLGRGSVVRIEGMPGQYVVLDKMNKRWERKIDVYMGSDVRAARRFGRRKVTLRWHEDDRLPAKIDAELISEWTRPEAETP